MSPLQCATNIYSFMHTRLSGGPSLTLQISPRTHAPLSPPSYTSLNPLFSWEGTHLDVFPLRRPRVSYLPLTYSPSPLTQGAYLDVLPGRRVVLLDRVVDVQPQVLRELQSTRNIAGVAGVAYVAAEVLQGPRPQQPPLHPRIPATPLSLPPHLEVEVVADDGWWVQAGGLAVKVLGECAHEDQAGGLLKKGRGGDGGRGEQSRRGRREEDTAASQGGEEDGALAIRNQRVAPTHLLRDADDTLHGAVELLEHC